MAAYKQHSIKILKTDREKADTILLEHWHSGDIDTTEVNEQTDSNGLTTVTYWIRPYVYEDYEAIKKEFQEKGIVLL